MRMRRSTRSVVVQKRELSQRHPHGKAVARERFSCAGELELPLWAPFAIKTCFSDMVSSLAETDISILDDGAESGRSRDRFGSLAPLADKYWQSRKDAVSGSRRWEASLHFMQGWPPAAACTSTPIVCKPVPQIRKTKFWWQQCDHFARRHVEETR